MGKLSAHIQHLSLEHESSPILITEKTTAHQLMITNMSVELSESHQVHSARQFLTCLYANDAFRSQDTAALELLNKLYFKPSQFPVDENFIPWTDTELRKNYVNLLLHQSLSLSNDSILAYLCGSMDMDVVAIRCKAMKAVQEILNVDSKMADKPIIREKIGDMLSDHSASVRESAIDVISKSILDDCSKTRFFELLKQRVLVYFDWLTRRM
jgi:hypothetical protein